MRASVLLFIVFTMLLVNRLHGSLSNQIVKQKIRPVDKRNTYADVGNSHPQLVTEPLSIMTFNVRKGSDADGSWKHRKKHAADVILRHRPAVVGIQEPTKEQMEYFMTTLGAKHFNWFPRDVPRCAVLYDTRQVVLEDSGHFWMSDRPQKPYTRFKGGTDDRTCVWGKFRRKSSRSPTMNDDSEVFYLFNVWMDSHSEGTRTLQAGLLVKKIEEIVEPVATAASISSNASKNFSVPSSSTQQQHQVLPLTFLVGDFNHFKREDAWGILTGEVKIDGVTGGFLNSWTMAKERVNTVKDTWHGFRGSHIADASGNAHIDCIVYVPPRTSWDEVSKKWKKAESVQVLQSTVVIDGNDNGEFPSDHFPVVSTFRF